MARKRDWQPYRGSAMIKVDRNSGQALLTLGGAILLLMYAVLALLISIPIIAVCGIFLWAGVKYLFF